jgi:hypothetical protein
MVERDHDRPRAIAASGKAARLGQDEKRKIDPPGGMDRAPPLSRARPASEISRGQKGPLRKCKGLTVEQADPYPQRPELPKRDVSLAAALGVAQGTVTPFNAPKNGISSWRTTWSRSHRKLALAETDAPCFVSCAVYAC